MSARILIVDDEPNVLATLQPILSREGYAVETAASAVEARHALSADRYDLVITDLRLPDGDVMEVVETTLRDDAPTLPVIVLTGFASLESAVDAMHRGVYDYLLKPCDVDELKATVRRALTHGRVLRERHRMPADVQKLVVDLDATRRELEMALGRERAMVAQLREREELRNQFIANVSHELKTPLTAIRGYCELLLRHGAGQDDGRAYLGAVLRASDQLRHLVEELLQMTEVEAGRLRVDPRPTDLREAIVAALALAKPLAAEKGIALANDVPTALPLVRADPARLGQVFNNLISNALKFTPDHGRVTIEVSAGGGLAHVRVKDTGVGIPIEEQPRLFTRFFRASTASPARPGLGLGLYITRAIVESHAGVVWIESEVGRGTTAQFTLPFAEEDRAAEPVSPATPAAARASPPATGLRATRGARRAPRR